MSTRVICYFRILIIKLLAPPLQPSFDQSADEAVSEKTSPVSTHAEVPTNEKKSISFALPPSAKDPSSDWCTTPVIQEEAAEDRTSPPCSGKQLRHRGNHVLWKWVFEMVVSHLHPSQDGLDVYCVVLPHFDGG